MKIVACIVSLAGFLGVAFGVHFYLEKTFASTDYVLQMEKRQNQYISQVDKRLDNKIKSDQMNEIQKRIWMLEDRAQTQKRELSKSEKEEVRSLKEKKDEINRQIAR